MHWIDWLILGAMTLFICVTAYTTRKYTRSVADFLAANRCAGKYVLGVADGIAGLGAVSIVALFEMHYKAGFSALWWGTMMLPFSVVVALSGWVQYRYRQTRVLTMAQFMEVRYSRRFRVLAGFLCFFSGIINFGIFPAVGGRFFQYFCGLPAWPVSVGHVEFDLTYASIMAVLLTISLAFTFMGGQIAVIVTDFAQGVFCNVAFCVLAVYVLFIRFDWSIMLEAFAAAPADASLINPAHSSEIDNFNATYFAIGLFGTILNFMSWQGNQGYYGCARTPHAARMGRVIGTLRPMVYYTTVVLLAVAAFTIMHHANYADMANGVRQVLSGVGNAKLQEQLTVTVALTHLLPTGLLGMLAAVMFAAFISTHDTYLHSWGSIFVQDVVLPIRLMFRGDNEPMSEKSHIRLLRCAIIGVALYIFFFSLFFSQQQDILMFFALTGTFYLGWAGWAICGGLYWKRGNTPGVWAAATVGLVLSIGGLYMTYGWANFQAISQLVVPGLWEVAVARYPDLAGDKCPVNAQILYFWTMVISGIAYVAVSLLTGSKAFDMDRMLHRGRYAIESDEAGELPPRGWQALKMNRHFTWDDKVLYILSLVMTLGMTAFFIVVTIMFMVFDVEFSNTFWSGLWWWYVVINFVGGVFITVWLTVGGVIDLRALLADLARAKRDANDDGTVVGDQTLVDLKASDARAERQPASEREE